MNNLKKKWENVKEPYFKKRKKGYTLRIDFVFLKETFEILSCMTIMNLFSEDIVVKPKHSP